MKLFTMTRTLVAAGAVASAVTFAVPAGAATHTPAAGKPAPHEVTAVAGTFPGGCQPRTGVRLIFNTSVHGFTVLPCQDKVTNLVVKVKLYRDGALIARDTNRAASGTNLRAEASKTCANPDQGIFQSQGRVSYDFQGQHIDTGWFKSPPLGGPCGI